MMVVVMMVARNRISRCLMCKCALYFKINWKLLYYLIIEVIEYWSV